MAKVNRTELNKLQVELIKKLDWGPANKWHSSMFTELSQKVFESTGVRLSPSTLKRFFGIINHKGTPSITTMDALSKYLGFENWRDFKLTKQNKLEGLREGISHKIIYSFIGFFTAIVFIIFIANKAQSPPEIMTNDITFSSRPVTNTYPNSVIFDFDLQSVKSDSLQIQQYWDPSKTISINDDQKQATAIYYFPGYFEAKLMVDGVIVKRHDLFLRSNGWLGTLEYQPIPKYFNPERGLGNKLYIPKELEEEVKESNDPLSIIYHYINDLGNVSGDDFALTASIRNTYASKWAVCQSSRIYIIGTNGAMIIPFSKIGCSSDNNLLLNDVYLSGKENDLTAFGTDLSDFTSIRILNKQKNITVYINEKEVFSSPYTETMGNLVGLRFKFLGVGEVASFELIDQNGSPVVF